MSLHPSEVLIRPVISEKSYEQIAQNQYTFRVRDDANCTRSALTHNRTDLTGHHSCFRRN